MNFAAKRKNMVECQLRVNKVIDDKVLHVMGSVPLEAFCPDNKKGVAYVDAPLPLGNGRFIMEPMVIGKMLQYADIEANHRVLIVGGGDGYMAALASRLASSVVVLDNNGDVARKGQEWFEDHQVKNVVFMVGDYHDSLPSHERFDVILVNGSVHTMPDAFFDYLYDNGKMMCVEDHLGGHMGQLVKYTKGSHSVSRIVYCDAFAPLIEDFAKKKSFAFI